MIITLSVTQKATPRCVRGYAIIIRTVYVSFLLRRVKLNLKISLFFIFFFRFSNSDSALYIYLFTYMGANDKLRVTGSEY